MSSKHDEASASTKRKRGVGREREAENVVDVPHKIELQNKQPGLPDDCWEKILKSLNNDSVTAFACVSKQLRRVQQRSRRVLKTGLGFWRSYRESFRYEIPVVTSNWCLWSMSVLPARKEDEKRALIMNAAAFSGHMDVLDRTQSGTPAGLFNEETCAFAAQGGHLEVLKYLHEKGCPWNEETCNAAAFEGHLDVLKYAHEHECPWHDMTCGYAAEAGHLAVLVYAHVNGCDFEISYSCENAALGGHLTVLVYLIENGCPWYGATCSGAAAGGNLEMVKYLHAKEFPWDERTCYAAARGGHLDVLKYAHEHGCPWDEEVCGIAFHFGHVEILKYLKDEGCPGYAECEKYDRKLQKLAKEKWL